MGKLRFCCYGPVEVRRLQKVNIHKSVWEIIYRTEIGNDKIRTQTIQYKRTITTENWMNHYEKNI
jgi:hypothetical protein